MTQSQSSRTALPGHPRFLWFAFIPVIPAAAWILVQSASPANLAACVGLALVGLGACAWSARAQRQAVQ
ncbi:chemotaxis protein, partial [Pseudomonas asgharzadehiana]